MATIKFPARMLDKEIQKLCDQNKDEYGKLSFQDNLAVLESDGLKYESFDDLEQYLRGNGIPYDRFSNGSDFKETVEGLLCFRPDDGSGEYATFVRTFGGHVMVKAEDILSILKRKAPCQTLLDAIKEHVLCEGHQCGAISEYV